MSVEYPNANVDQFLLVFVTVLHSIAAVTTCLRLWVRVRLHRLWWEDAWAALALCLNVICGVSTWTLTLPQRDQPWYMSRESHIVSMWLTLFSHTCVLWAARMSIMFSLIRVVPRSDRMRCIASSFAVLFFFLWALCVASKAYTCGSNRSWYNLPDFQCPIGLPTAAIEFTTDVVSDVILVALPTWILWWTRLPRNERVLMLSIFTMSLLSVLASVVHVAFLIPVSGYTASMTADIEGALDLTICNLLVLVTSLYRFFRNGEDIEGTDDSGLTAKPPDSSSLRTAMDTLTTVDLECLEVMSIRSTQSAPITQSEAIPIRNLSSRSCFNVLSEHSY